MRLLRAHVLAVILSLPASFSATAQTRGPRAGMMQTADPPVGHDKAGVGMKGMSMSGMDMSGMMISGMTPPTPKPPPPGQKLELNATEPMVKPAVRGSPGELTLAFDRPMKLDEVILTNAVGQQVPIHQTLPSAPVESLSFPVSIPLRPGDYRLDWSSDQPGPFRRGRLAFTVQQANGSAMPEAQMSHRHY